MYRAFCVVYYLDKCTTYRSILTVMTYACETWVLKETVKKQVNDI